MKILLAGSKGQVVFGRERSPQSSGDVVAAGLCISRRRHMELA